MRVPRQIVLDTTAMCNLKCTCCPNNDESINKYGTRGHMNPDLFKSVVDRIVLEKLDTSITACLLGEALLHPDIVELMQYVVDKNVPAYLTTNTSIWNEELFQLLTDNNSIYQIVLSNNGLFEDYSNSIEKCMVGLDRNLSKSIIEYIVYLRNKKASETEIGIKIIRRGQDYEEIENLISYWLEKGLDFVAVGRPLIQSEGGMRIYPCRHFDDMAMYVRWDGTLIPCSFNTKVVNEHAYDLGILDKTSSLVDVYNNDKYKELRRRHYNRDFPEVCQKCAIAYTGEGLIGEVYFRNASLPRKKIYYHEDYSNTFYSYKKKYTRVSFLRKWEKDNEI